MSLPWQALHVRSQHERKVRDALHDRLNLETYLPVYEERSRWTDRTKVIERCLFPGYVFAQVEVDENPALRRKVVQLAGVARILGRIPHGEIEGIRKLLASGLPISPHPYLAPGDRLEAGRRVRIERGALAGYEGTVIRMKGLYRIVVSIDMLRRSVAAELDTDALVVLSK